MADIENLLDSLNEFIKTNPNNKVEELDNMSIYDEPIIGIASVDDPLFISLKDESIIGPHHMTPKEWFPEGKSVISYFIPFNLRVRRSNRADTDLPSLEWLYGRIEGENFNNLIRKFISKELINFGNNTLVPAHDSRFSVVDRRSNWSERHIAYIAGLGTFNLGKNLITEKGCAGRFGSIITDLNLTPTKRPYKSIYEYCNNCGACISRCPVSAITQNGKEHNPCDVFLETMKEKYAPRYGCGKCQTSVPCESRIPNK